MEVNYKEKYLKYKKKYLDLKKQIEIQYGGDFFNWNNKNTDYYDNPLFSTIYDAAKLGTKTAAATTEFATKFAYRKFKCLANLSTVGEKEKQDEIKKYILKVLEYDVDNTIKNILIKNIKEISGNGSKLSKVDRFKDNISLLIQAYKQILGYYDGTAEKKESDYLLKVYDGTTMKKEKSFTSYQDYDNIDAVVNKIYGKGIQISIDDVINLEYIRGMVDCYCKSFINWTDDAQVAKLAQCLPENFFMLNWINIKAEKRALQAKQAQAQQLQAQQAQAQQAQDQQLQAQQLQAQQLQAQQLQAQQAQAQQLQAQQLQAQKLSNIRAPTPPRNLVQNPVLGQIPPGYKQPGTQLIPPPGFQQPGFQQPGTQLTPPQFIPPPRQFIPQQPFGQIPPGYQQNPGR